VISLEASDLHWICDPPEYDTCVHGAVTLEIDDRLISDGKDDDWTVSGSALLFLRSIEKGHTSIELGPQLIPHCAIPDFVENGNVLWFGCGLGIDWQIELEGDRVVHRFEDDSVLEVSSSEWKLAVVRFATQILEFIESEPERQFAESALEDGRPAFELYFTELRTLIEKHMQSLPSP